MTIDEIYQQMKDSNPQWTLNDLAKFAAETISSLESRLHVAQTQITAAQDDGKEMARRWGGELIARQRYQLELETLKKTYGVSDER